MTFIADHIQKCKFDMSFTTILPPFFMSLDYFTEVRYGRFEDFYYRKQRSLFEVLFCKEKPSPIKMEVKPKYRNYLFDCFVEQNL